MWTRVKIILVFALLGPLIGGLVGCPVFFWLLGAGFSGNAGRMSATCEICLTFGPLFGVGVGWLPALLSGVVLAFIGTEPKWRHTILAMTVSTTVTLIYMALARGTRHGRPNMTATITFDELVATMLVAAAVSGGVCWLLIAATTHSPVQFLPFATSRAARPKH